MEELYLRADSNQWQLLCKKEDAGLAGFVDNRRNQGIMDFAYEKRRRSILWVRYLWRWANHTFGNHKTDIITKELPGAKLKVSDSEGERCGMSDIRKQHHIIKELEVGKKYTLTETICWWLCNCRIITFVVENTADIQKEMQDDTTKIWSVRWKDRWKQKGGRVRSCISLMKPGSYGKLTSGDRPLCGETSNCTYTLLEETAPKGYTGQ